MAKHGNGVRFRGKPKEQFDFYVRKNPITGCWIWTGAIFKQNGYGQMTNNMLASVPITAHRAAWMLYRGPIPKGLMVLHKCDVRKCVNPEHLYVGNNADNMRDRSQRGIVHQRRLTEEKVREMRQLRQQGWSWRQLGKRYDVGFTAVVQATMGKSWAFVDEPIPTIKIGPGRRKCVKPLP